MVHTTSDVLVRFPAAARAMMEGDLVDTAAGRFSTTMFVGGIGRNTPAVGIALDAAAEHGFGVIALEFEPGDQNGPRSWTAAVLVDGEQIVLNDCVAWLGRGDRALLVPRDGDRYVMVTEQGLTLRQGRPAASLTGGIIRARKQLTSLARTQRAAPGIAIVEIPLAA
jgi:hypothetical protein